MPRLLSFYGDDFTGSTDVMEALSVHGVRTVLFTRIPDGVEMQAFSHYGAVGIAGTSRSQTPDWMDEHLPEVFTWLKQQHARFCHYKVCSTFDSSPHIGSIGRAIDIGRKIFNQRTTPLVVGAPQLKRYTAFGHLFAGYQGETYRIDRHPVMSRHPVTPMDESDLRIHLSRQTRVPVKLVAAPMLAAHDKETISGISGEEAVVLFDVLDHESQLETGHHLLNMADKTGPFVVGSSGVEYALVRAMAEQGTITGRAEIAPLPRVERIMAVSGSCSPTTARQIRHALNHGFTGIYADPLELAGGRRESVTADLVTRSTNVLNENRSVLIYTALDPETDRGAALDDVPGARHRVGESLGRILKETLRIAGLGRAIIAGGDTSSHALGQLDVYALTMRFPLRATPGSPLCRAWSSDRTLDGLEIAMKGGQVGGDNYFVALRDGIAIA